MKAYEAAKKLKMKSKDFCRQYNIDSHLSVLEDALVEELFGEEKKIDEARPEATQTVDSAETVVVTEDILMNVRILGKKSKYWNMVNG